MYCSKCGAQLKPNDAFCAKCGKPVASNTNKELSANTTSQLDIWQNYQSFWLNFINFKGISKRTPFWVSTILNIIITIILLIIGIAGGDELTGQASPILYIAILFIIVSLCPQLAITFRRFNDVNKHKWTIWANLILPIYPILAIASGTGDPISALLLFTTIGFLVYNFIILILPSKESV